DLGQLSRAPRPRAPLRRLRGGAADRAADRRPALRRADRAPHRRRLRGGDRLARAEAPGMTQPALEAVIGLEVHAELLTRSKVFCGCSAAFGAPPDTNVCPVCLGMPGVLPVLNRRVVEFAIRAGLATHCRIAPRSVFARKNYFYPDLPKGYQISQYELPLCTGGHLDVLVDGTVRRIGLTRIHIEEDTGKNLHDVEDAASLVDFNRSGVPLLEIVSEPDLRSPAEAGAYLRMLRAILQYLEICDGNMEEGSFRCDANVSVRPHGQAGFGTKVEVKNMNSFRAFEIARQTEALAAGERLRQETRLWDADREETRPMRAKEHADDYRYFPEPDLPPLVVDPAWVEEIRASLPERPGPRPRRWRTGPRRRCSAWCARKSSTRRSSSASGPSPQRRWRASLGSSRRARSPAARPRPSCPGCAAPGAIPRS